MRARQKKPASNQSSLHLAPKLNNSLKEKNRGVLQSAKNTLLCDCWLATRQHDCTQGVEKKSRVASVAR